MTTNRTPRPATTIPAAAAILGAGGLVPFVGLALAPLWSHELFNRPPLAVLGLYAAVILSFMGAIHWGLAMAEPSDPSTTGSNPTGRYVASVLPALLGWFALAFLPQFIALRVIAGAFALLLAYDLRAIRSGAAPPWYARLRWPLTLIVVPSLLLASMLA